MREVIPADWRLAPTAGDPDAFKALRSAEGLAVCAALAGK